MELWLSGALAVSYRPQYDVTFFQIFEIVTGNILFRHEPNPSLGLSATEDILFQMINCNGGENFRAAQLQVCALAGEYFRSDCMLLI